MGIRDLAILKDATIAISGGTAQSFVPDNAEVKGGVHVVDASETNFLLRESVTCKAKSPTKKADGTYTKEIRSIKGVKPWLDADGVIQYDSVEAFVSLAAGSPNRSELRNKGAQFFVDSDTDSFYSVGNLD